MFVSACQCLSLMVVAYRRVLVCFLLFHYCYLLLVDAACWFRLLLVCSVDVCCCLLLSFVNACNFLPFSFFTECVSVCCSSSLTVAVGFCLLLMVVVCCWLLLFLVVVYSLFCCLLLLFVVTCGLPLLAVRMCIASVFGCLLASSFLFLLLLDCVYLVVSLCWLWLSSVCED